MEKRKADRVRPKSYNKKFRLASLTEAGEKQHPITTAAVLSDNGARVGVHDDLAKTVNEDIPVELSEPKTCKTQTETELFDGDCPNGNMTEECTDSQLTDGGKNAANVSEEILKLLYDIRQASHTDEIYFDEDSKPIPDRENAAFYYESEQEEDAGPEETNEDETIYAGHTMTTKVSMLLILMYSISHGVSSSQLSDLLTLIGLHCIKVYPGLKSLFHFQKYFADFKSPIIKHYYCQFCFTCVSQETEICPNQMCSKGIRKDKTYFLEVSIVSQLQTLFQRDGFAEAIRQRHNRTKTREENIEDIFDGEVYQKLVRNEGPLSDKYPFNLSFILNTDGVPIFKSSKFSIWPVYLMINELPKTLRKRTENLLLCGLWFGDSKPFMPCFSKPLRDSLKTLETVGTDIQIHGHTETCKGFLICSTADLPARSVLLNMNQFNGAHSCWKCNQAGETYKTGKGGSVHVFPYSVDNPFGQPRDTAEVMHNAISAAESGKPVNGIKGPSFLMTLNSYDFIQGSAIDYMHGVLLGITKLLLKLWFSPTFSKESFSVAIYVDVIDKRLVGIKPPYYITRVPRAVSSHMKYWKASELRSWLFFYSLPTLMDVLDESYLLHFAAFVEAITILSGNSIDKKLIPKSELLLKYFVMMFPTLYGERYSTLNLHMLLHLPQCVRELGPLWVYSCFAFENANGEITKLFHGTQNIELQIVSSVNIVQNLPILAMSLPVEYSKFANRLQNTSVGILAMKNYSGKTQMLGSGYSKMLPKTVLDALTTLLGEESKITFFNRILFRGQMYHSKDYARVTQRNSYTVKYFCQKSGCIRYGYVLFFGKHFGIEIRCFAFISPLTEKYKSMLSEHNTPNEIGVTVPHIHRVVPTNCLIAIPVDHIICLCVNVTMDDVETSYVCEPPNFTETD